MAFPSFPELRMISPTGGGIRNDTQGHGYYGAKDGKKKKTGAEYTCCPNNDVYASIDGVLTKVIHPYKDKKFEGVVIENEFVTIELTHISPFPYLIGQQVRQGQPIGHAQDIRKKDGERVVPYVGFKILSIDPNLFIRS